MIAQSSSVASTSLPQRGLMSTLRMPMPQVLVAHMFLVYAGLLYTVGVVEPSLRSGRYRDGYYLQDSFDYFRTAVGFHLSSLFHHSPALTSAQPQGLIPSLGLTNSLLYVQEHVATFVSSAHPEAVVFVLNYGLLVAALFCVARVARRLGLEFSANLQLLVIANPMVWLNMVSLTKDIWGVFFVSVFALGCVERRVALTIGFGLVSTLAREWYLVVALAIVAVTFFRIGVLRLLVVTSVLIGGFALTAGAHDLSGFSETRSLDLGQRSAHVMSAVAALQHYPLGQVVVFPVVLVFDLSAWLNGNQWNAVSKPYVAANLMSSALFTLVLVAALLRRRRRTRERLAEAWLVRVLGAFAIVVSLYPISQHRYLVPAWPLLVLLLAGASKTDLAPSGVEHEPGV